MTEAAMRLIVFVQTNAYRVWHLKKIFLFFLIEMLTEKTSRHAPGSCPFGHLSIVSPRAQWMPSILDSHRLEKWCYTLNPVTKRSLEKKTLCEEVHLIIPLFIIIPAASSLYSLKNWKVTRGVYFRGFILYTNWDPTSYKSDISFVRSENTGGHSDPKWML